MKQAKNSKKKLIIILCPYPRGGAPSQRFRYEQYLDQLEAAGCEYRIFSFIDDATYRILYQPGRTLRKAWGITMGFVRRLGHISCTYRAALVFVHREASPLGPPWVEWIITHVLRKPLVYDFDDAIWLSDRSGINDWVARLKWRSKVRKICRWSYSVSAGNDYLAGYARPFNPRVRVNPTTIDTEHHHNTTVNQRTKSVSMGWTGSHSTLKYLAFLKPVLQQLAQLHEFSFVVIADRPPEFDLPNLTFVPWKQASEIDDLLRIQVGVMPLPDDDWSRGKCGFKALQYMALGIPAVVSPVGVNTTLVQPGIQGYHCRTESEWFDALERLIQDEELRRNQGQAGRARVIEKFSIRSNTNNFLGLLP